MEYLLTFKKSLIQLIIYTYSKLNYYGIRGTANNRFSSYLENRTQFLSINSYSADLIFIRFDVPPGSILGPLLFLV